MVTEGAFVQLLKGQAEGTVAEKRKLQRTCPNNNTRMRSYTMFVSCKGTPFQGSSI